MFSRSGLLFVAAVFILAVCAAVPARAGDEWVEVHSPNFTVATDGGEKRGRDVALRLEQMRAAFGVIVNRNQINIPVPVEVIAFKSSKETRQNSPLFNGKPVELTGYFQPGQDRNYIILDLSANNALEATFHEYGHMLLNGNYPEMPVWFDEGFAEYYQTITVDHRTIVLGKAPQYAGDFFRQYSLMPVEQLLSVRHDSKVYNESGDHRSMFYMESWLLVHYIFDRKKLREMGQYAQLVEQEQVAPVEALQRAFGMTPAQLQKELQAHLRSLTVWTYTLSGEIKPADFSVRPLRPLDAQVILADLHLHQMDFQERATQEFKAILQQDPTNTAAHRGLGYASLRKGDFETAAEEFRQAAKDTNDARVLYYSALLAHLRGPSTPDDIADMKDQATRAVALDPGFADAYSMLAFADAAQGDVDAGLKAVQTAVALSPRNESYAQQLAQLYMLHRDWDAATSIYTRLKDSSNGAIALQSEEALDVIAKARAAKDVRVQMIGNRVEMMATTAPAQPTSSPDRAFEEPPPTAPSDVRPIKFLKGKLVSVDCSSGASATLTVNVGTASWTMHVADIHKVVVLGADGFSCGWHDEKVAINFRSAGTNTGDVVSVEIE